MRVLVACEYSGVVRDAFIRAGHDAISCDLLPAEQPGPHYEGDVRDIINDGFDLLIGHPPCTYLANSGVSWLHKRPERWEQMRDGARFFRELLNADIPMKAIENPIMHKYAVEIIGRRQDQVIQPWMFGHPEQKATGLWLVNLPPLMPTKNMRMVMGQLPKSEQQRIHHLAPGPDRWKERSRTFPGIAEAMALQWGNLDNTAADVA